MSDRPLHYRRRLNAARSSEPVLGEVRLAEMLEDRTLLSAVPGFDGRDDLLIDPVELEDIEPRDIYSELEQLVAGFVEAQLAVAETADLEPLGESRDHFGEVRIAAPLHDDIATVLAEHGLMESDVWFEVLAAETSAKGIEVGFDSPDDAENLVPDLIDESVVTDLQIAAEVLSPDQAISMKVPVTVRLHVFLSEAGRVSLGLEAPNFIVKDSLIPDLGFAASGNAELAQRVGNSGIAEAGDAPIETMSEPVLADPIVFAIRSAEVESHLEPRFVAVTTTGTATQWVEQPLASGELAEGIETSDFLLALASDSQADSTATLVEVGLETWRPEDIGWGTAATLAATAVGSVETQMLLASVEPSEISGVVSEPLQPLLGLASSVVLMVQTIGRTALLAVFGEGGGSGGPIAEFVEPIIDLADIGEPAERWEMKTVDAVVRGPVAQVVSGNRHFEIRNIGPAANLDNALPDVATLTLLTLPRHGVLEHVGVRQNVFRYVPDPGFSGVDEFRYRLKTASGESHEGQMVINVPEASSHFGVRTATRDIELRLDVDRHVAATNDAFEAFEDWRGGLD